jgi:hypothetical protein
LKPEAFSYVSDPSILAAVGHMLKAIYAQGSREAANQKAKAIIEDLRAGNMSKAADLVEHTDLLRLSGHPRAEDTYQEHA